MLLVGAYKRLSKSEVEAFAKEGCAEERTEFAGGTLIYSDETTNAKTLLADYTNGKLTLFVPENLLRNWAHTSLVGISYNMSLSNGRYLSILLEKDFKCVDAERKEDQSDYFENPFKNCW